MPGLLLTVLALHGTLALMSSLVTDPAKRSQLTLALLSSALPGPSAGSGSPQLTGPVWLAARMSTKLQYYLRLGVYLGGLASAAAFGIVASASLALMGMRENANFVVARFFCASSALRTATASLRRLRSRRPCSVRRAEWLFQMD